MFFSQNFVILYITVSPHPRHHDPITRQTVTPALTPHPPPHPFNTSGRRRRRRRIDPGRAGVWTNHPPPTHNTACVLYTFCWRGGGDGSLLKVSTV
jgi:hypothetical protein